MVALALFAMAGVSFGAYQYQQRQKAEKAHGLDEIAEIKKESETLSKRLEELEKSTPSPVSSSAPEPVTNSKTTVSVKTTPTTVQSQLSKKEQCEAQALKAKLEIQKKLPELKEKRYNQPGLVELKNKRLELIKQLQESDNSSDIAVLSEAVKKITDDLYKYFTEINTEIDKIPTMEYEKVLSACLNS